VKVVILCGGQGMRIRAGQDNTPKVLFEIGGRPIVWHIMKSYRQQGLREFVLCLGYGADSVRRYFTKGDSAADPVVHASDPAEDWDVTLVDTGETTNTGGRVCKAAPYIGNGTFMVTYGDGVADVHFDDLLQFHKAHGKVATLTAVRPWSQFGLLSISPEGQVERFREKPRLRSWVNGGFFVFEPAVLGYIDGDPVLEQEPFRALSAAGELLAYRHNGFWACMDTYKDLVVLNDLWSNGKAAWRSW
jgi:glucose-1-phosphate cytidylyltransferase